MKYGSRVYFAEGMIHLEFSDGQTVDHYQMTYDIANKFRADFDEALFAHRAYQMEQIKYG
jgi:hypothetical protein